MIELNEKAGNYAEANVINVLKEAFAKVYADGYRDGYKDRAEEIPVNMRPNQTKYVDLGLPSGTLWSDDYERTEEGIMYLPYEEAEKMGIPTEEQWNELLEHCRFYGDYSSSGLTFYGLIFIGPNGNSIKFRSKGYMKDKTITGNINYGGGKVYFWISDKEVNDAHEKKVILADGGTKRTSNIEVSNFFSGYKTPIRLVK